MPEGLYETDILTWSDEQAALLRRLAAGESVNASVDWPNIIEEVQDLGRSELHRCESFIEQILLHLLKLHGMPNSDSVRHWRVEVVTFRKSLARRYTPSMRQLIKVESLYADALDIAVTTIGGQPARPLPVCCPFDLDQLTNRQLDIDQLLALTSVASAGGTAVP